MKTDAKTQPENQPKPALFEVVLNRRGLLTASVATAVGGASNLRSTDATAQTAASRPAPIDPELKQKYDQAVAAYYDGLFTGQPSIATFYGEHGYDHLLENGTASSYLEISAFYKRSLAHLLDLKPRLPKSTELNDLEALIGRIEGDILYSTKIQTWRKDPGFYPAIAHSALSGMMTWIDKSSPPMDYESKKRRDEISKKLLVNVVLRLKAVPGLLENGQKNIADPPKSLVRYAQESMIDQIAFFDNELPARFVDAGPDFEIAIAEAQTAFANYQKTLKTLGETTRGPEMFSITTEHLREHFRCFELSAVEPKELLNNARDRLAAEAKLYMALAEKLIQKITIQPRLQDVNEVNTWVKTNLIPARDEIMPTARRQMELLKGFLEQKNIISIPRDYPEYPSGYTGVINKRDLPSSPEVADGGGWNCSGPPPLEDVNPWRAIYNTTVPAADVKGKDLTDQLADAEVNGLLVTTAHEVWPGHYMQYLTALTQQEKQSKARKLAWSVPGSATNEGWAHYVEEMVVDQGLAKYMADNKWPGDDDFLRFGLTSNSLLRTGRLIVSLSVQMGEIKSVETAAKFLETECFQTPFLAQSEAVRASYYGATDINYTFGKMMIQKLRKDYERATNAPNGWLKSFHDKLLNAGQVPLSIIRREIMPENSSWDGKMW